MKRKKSTVPNENSRQDNFGISRLWTIDISKPIDDESNESLRMTNNSSYQILLKTSCTAR